MGFRDINRKENFGAAKVPTFYIYKIAYPVLKIINNLIWFLIDLSLYLTKDYFICDIRGIAALL
jgi:hypothetical protein